MDVVTGALGNLICKLGQLLSKEYELQKDAGKKLESLIKELECAQAALRQVGGVPPDQLDDQVRIWAREVRDASYDMEDLIDTSLVPVDGSHQHSVDQESFLKRLCDLVPRKLFEPLMPRKLFKRRKISGAVDEINKGLEEITQRRDRFTVNDSITIAKPAPIDPRLAAMYKEVTELVGIEESSSELTAMLLAKKMVSIVGVGGLGKTTLAKSMYDKRKVDFECSAFVTVGRNPDLKKVFQDIIRDIDKEEYKKHTEFYKDLNEQQLIDELRETFLGNKRYLLVIDDVWETRSWETIKLALVQKNSGSRVITTTRILEVAKEAGEVFKLQHLPYGKSKELFSRRIFGAEAKCPYNQLDDEVSDKILKKCGGVPLAIITMASLLVGKSREEWIEVCSSIAFHDKDNKQVSDTEWILSLSYYDLPPHLKTCLLYLSVFAEDKFIPKDSLIWMWVAEGFVHNNKPGSSLREVGNGYFNELINRSMIQAVESEEDDMMVLGCRVHDMVLDFLRLKAQEDNFVTVSSSNNGEEATSSSPSRVRRLTLQNQKELVEHTRMDHGHVRSFIAYRCDIDDGFSVWTFKLLRVLVLERCTTLIYLKHLENLHHLRYLGLQNSWIDQIPEEIGALKFLQTLDMEGTFGKTDWLPSSVGLLTQLICLRAINTEAPKGVIEKLTSLEQLEIRASLDTVRHFVKELGKLRELRVLKARVLKANLATPDHSVVVIRDLVESLGNLDKIRHLELDLGCFISYLDKAMWETVALPRPLQCLIVTRINFSELPSSICPSNLPNLTRLNLSVRYMEDRHLKILGQLPELSHLRLVIHSSDSAAKVTVTSTAGTSTITDACLFQKLRSLSLAKSAVLFLPNEDSSVVLFVLNKDSASRVSLTVGNKCIVAPTVMPNLQVLKFCVDMESEVMAYLKGGVNIGICEHLGLDCLPSLQRVHVSLQCYSEARFVDKEQLKAADEQWKAALGREEAALWQAIEGHPNRPTLKMDIEGNRVNRHLRRFWMSTQIKRGRRRMSTQIKRRRRMSTQIKRRRRRPLN